MPQATIRLPCRGAAGLSADVIGSRAVARSDRDTWRDLNGRASQPRTPAGRRRRSALRCPASPDPRTRSRRRTPPCWNWHTGTTQNRLPLRACGFESHRGYRPHCRGVWSAGRPAASVGSPPTRNARRVGRCAPRRRQGSRPDQGGSRGRAEGWSGPVQPSSARKPPNVSSWSRSRTSTRSPRTPTPAGWWQRTPRRRATPATPVAISTVTPPSSTTPVGRSAACSPSRMRSSNGSSSSHAHPAGGTQRERCQRRAPTHQR